MHCRSNWRLDAVTSWIKLALFPLVDRTNRIPNIHIIQTYIISCTKIFRQYNWYIDIFYIFFISYKNNPNITEYYLLCAYLYKKLLFLLKKKKKRRIGYLQLVIQLEGETDIDRMYLETNLFIKSSLLLRTSRNSAEEVRKYSFGSNSSLEDSNISRGIFNRSVGILLKL